MEFFIKRTITGKQQVHYECPKCNEPLVSDFAEAGQADTCPNCESGFRVPGKEELQRIQREERESVRQREIAAEKERLASEEDAASAAVERAMAEAAKIQQHRLAAQRERVRACSEVLGSGHNLVGQVVRALEVMVVFLTFACSIGLILFVVGWIAYATLASSPEGLSNPLPWVAYLIGSFALLGVAAAVLRIEKSARAAAMAVIEIAELLTDWSERKE